MSSIKKEKNVVAAFDFDGTITAIDTLNDLLIKEFGIWRFIKVILKNSIIIFLYLLRIASNCASKQKVFSGFFRGFEENRFNEVCNNYSLNRINQIVRPEAIQKIMWHKKNGHKVVIISASIENWIKPWAEINGIDNIISTKAEIKGGMLTGNFSNENCYGAEKVRRLLEEYPKREDYVLYAYGDSKGDKELLAEADYKFFRSFN